MISSYMERWSPTFSLPDCARPLILGEIKSTFQSSGAMFFRHKVTFMSLIYIFRGCGAWRFSLRRVGIGSEISGSHYFPKEINLRGVQRQLHAASQSQRSYLGRAVTPGRGPSRHSPAWSS